ncbi:(Fe-S)-binding protein [Brevibacterium sp. UCMA 11754]|uniref:(Fe-S)-binding protein n=1 Tax=Brevibacterium sp. UCMA 11754 TaxID=2749198 RepID=UPI002E24AECB
MADTTGSGGFMCPSYLATRDEKDSTRDAPACFRRSPTAGLINDWNSAAVHESLDLCLSCKACGSDCPAGVDMAQYKSEVLHRTYKGKVRPLSHYSLGWLPIWGKALTAVSGVSAIPRSGHCPLRPLAKLVLAGGGMDTRRGMVSFNTQRFSRWRRRTSRRPRPATNWWENTMCAAQRCNADTAAGPALGGLIL